MKKLWSVLLVIGFVGLPAGAQTIAVHSLQSSPFRLKRHATATAVPAGQRGPQAVAPNAAAPTDATPADSAPIDGAPIYSAGSDPFAARVIAMINSDRAQNGCAPVVQCPKLSRVAQDYAEFLLRTGYFAHVDPAGRTPEDRAQAGGFMTPVSENLAWEMSSFEDTTVLLKRAEAGMMAEPRNERNHRYNILNGESRYVGVGIARSGEKVVMVQEFAPDNK